MKVQRLHKVTMTMYCWGSAEKQLGVKEAKTSFLDQVGQHVNQDSFNLDISRASTDLCFRCGQCQKRCYETFTEAAACCYDQFSQWTTS